MNKGAQYWFNRNRPTKPIDTEQRDIMSKVDEIKQALPLPSFIARYTNGLKPSGPGFFIGRCPFHQKPTDPPSKRKFWVNERLGVCGCFVPRCAGQQPNGKPMDIINFWARLQDIPNNEAIEDLWKMI